MLRSLFHPVSVAGLSAARSCTALLLLTAGGLSAQTPTFTSLVEFTGTTGGKLGLQPIANLYQATDGLLYGTTTGGGSGGGYGTIFKVTSGGTHTVVRNFTGPTGATVGIYGYPGIVQHTDGVFYGMTSGNDSGVTAAGFGNIYSINNSGTYDAPATHRFGGTSAANRGQAPVASFLATNGKLYGTTELGGSRGKGTLFSMTPSGTITYHIDFTDNETSNKGSRPQAQLLDAGDGYLYGSTLEGGTNGHGTIFRFSLSTNTLTTLVNFTNTSGTNPGKNPYDALIKASDGNLYGTTANGGAFSSGTVFRINLPSLTHTVLAEFTGNTGAYQGLGVSGRLVQHGNGLLYGTTFGGGAGGFGTIYSITMGGYLTPKVLEFTGTSGNVRGAGPWTGMIKASDGHLYGTTRFGGAGNFGTVFKLQVPNFSAPAVTTSAATAVGSTAATLNGTINPNGANTTWLFEYGTTLSYGATTAATVTSNGTTALSVSANLSGLSSNVTYNYRLVGYNPAGIVQGANLTFNTNNGAPVLPTVTTTAASGVGADTATLNGTVNPNGSATSWRFEYGTTTGYGSLAPASAGDAGSGNSAQGVNTTLSGLLSGTTYYYRLTATNTAGTANGSQGSFTTSGPPPEPTVVTGSASNITGTTARLNGTVNPRGAAAQWRFEWGLSPAFGNTAPASAGTTGTGSSDQTVSADISGILPGATIFYRLTAWRAATPGTVATGTNSFFVTPPLPDVTTDAAISLSTSGATLTGTVNPRGLATTWQFEYGENGFDTSVPVSPGNAGSGNTAASVSQNITGLAPGTTIQYRLKATSSAGTAVGATQTFTTYQPPTVSTGTAGSITATGAVLQGTVNPHGFESSYQFQYGTTTAYGQTTASAPAGSGSSAVNANASLTGLLPGTTYYYRLTATSTHGTANGTQGTFTTAPNIRSWRQQYFGTMNNSGNAQDDADPDGDGVKNLLEYGFGMNPTLRDGHLQPVPSWNGSNLIMSFTKPSSVNDVTYTCQVSTNLRDWSLIANSGGGNAVTYSAPVSTVGRNWMRIRVTLIP